MAQSMAQSMAQAVAHAMGHAIGHATAQPTGPLSVLVVDHAAALSPARPLPRSLRRQGDLLWRALLSDLGALPGIDVATAASLAAVPSSGAFDAVWPLVLESGGSLECLSRDILRGRRILLGSAPATVGVTASKLALTRALAAGGVATVATCSPHAPVTRAHVTSTTVTNGVLPNDCGPWVVKPDDGAGCLQTRLFRDRAAALAWIRASAAPGYVLQPFVAGKPGSLSLLCCDGVAQVLACNHERVAMRDNRFHVLGCIVNGLVDDDGALAHLAQQVTAALPGLWGYVGVSFILTARGAVVLDVNPRLTAAYAGLHASIGRNPAALVLDLLSGRGALPLPAPPRGHRPISVDVGS
ncbi:ATP-grasp domain-containing protein [Massilia aurea]|uniref:ATP-grasp domain-containing protein n=1 Tax=Massilia aurea TaxID=373040 RepID=UPI003462192B